MPLLCSIDFRLDRFLEESRSNSADKLDVEQIRSSLVASVRTQKQRRFGAYVYHILLETKRAPNPPTPTNQRTHPLFPSAPTRHSICLGAARLPVSFLRPFPSYLTARVRLAAGKSLSFRDAFSVAD